MSAVAGEYRRLFPSGGYDAPAIVVSNRVSWVSESARKVWEPRMGRIREAWKAIEWLSVQRRVRRCALIVVDPQDLPTTARDMSRRGLVTAPMAALSKSQPGYVNTGAAPSGGNLVYRVVVGGMRDVRRFTDAWEGGDDARMGRLLGYPVCCIRFFEAVWVDGALDDTTWPMSANTHPVGEPGECIEIGNQPLTNLLWKTVGLRAVFHLPCRWTCKATSQVADGFMRIGREAGFEDEMEWLGEILAWPVLWSSLHGIAEIVTPVMRFSASTDPSLTKHTVRYMGEMYPIEGAAGAGFPFRRRAERGPRGGGVKTFEDRRIHDG